MLKELKEDVWKVKKMICEQNGNIEDIENLKRNQKETLEPKNSITEMKNSLADSKADLNNRRKIQ